MQRSALRGALYGALALSLLACGAEPAAPRTGGSAGAPGAGGAAGGAGNGGSGGEAELDAGAGGSDAGGSDAGVCEPAEGSAQIDLRIAGLPEGTEANVLLTGPSGAVTLGSSFAAEVPSGLYLLEPGRVALPGSIVRALYDVDTGAAERCVLAGTTWRVDLTYARIPTSERLWTSSSNGDVDLVALDGPALALATEVPTTEAVPAFSAVAGAGSDLTFDADGNLWTFGATLAEPHLMRFSRAALAAAGAAPDAGSPAVPSPGSSSPEPDRSIDLEAVTCLPATLAMAFRLDGSLWIATCGGRVFRLDPDDLAADASPSAELALSGLEAPTDLAFDIFRNLWIADERVLRFDAARLDAASEPPADLTLTVRDAGDTRDLSASRLAFDTSGNLWLTDFGANLIARVDRDELETSGARPVVASVSLALSVGSLLDRPAFDEGGGLWIAAASGSLARLSSEQLLASSTPGAPTVPATIITVPGMGTARRLALFPAPSELPLHHRFR